MREIVISAENLSKEYRIGTINHGVLFRDLQSWWAKMRGQEDPNTKIQASGSKPANGYFKALDNVSFEVQQGEALGIIGRNGAGKSTLLKILSRVTSPTQGVVRLKGRVASLLEVGTGFHPELTGRENIFLNGAILGMTKKEIAKKLDEIIDFAGVEQFIDTPVKRYSSGMYVRLAFAVAAHLEPEILVVDEVLAVGDAQFQSKCLGKMRDVGKEGRTVLFVSHNMGAIEQLCTSALLLKNGAIAQISTDVVSVVKNYVFAHDSSESPRCWLNPGTGEFDNDYFKPLKFYFTDADGNEIKQMPVRNDDNIWITVVGEVRRLDPATYFGVGVFTETNTFLFGSMFFDTHPDRWPKLSLGINTLRCQIPRHLLNEGVYKIEMHGGRLHQEFYFYPGVQNPVIFLEINGGLSESPLWREKRLGLFAPVLQWENFESERVSVEGS